MGIGTKIRRWFESESLADSFARAFMHWGPGRKLKMLGSNEERYWHPFGDWFPPTASGMSVSAESALRVATVFACVRVLAETMAQLPIHVYERLSAGRKRLADEHPLNFLFLSPNGWQTWFEFVEFEMGGLGLRGNAYAERIAGPRGATTELRPLRSDRMEVERLDNGKLRYTFTDPETYKKTTYGQEEIFHVRGPHMTGDGLTAMSPISAAREAIGLAMATETHGATFFGNGARPGYVFATDQPIKNDAAKQVLDLWNKTHGGAFNANKPAILPWGLKPVSIGMTNEDSQFLDTRRFQVEEIARIYRVPLHLINDLTKSSFSNIEQQSLEFVMYTMLPWIKRWEQAISRDLIAEPGRFYVKFNVNGLLRGDSTARSAFYREMVNAGIFDINMVLELEDMNPIKNGDVHLVQGAMTTLDRVVNPPEPPAPAMSPVLADDTEPDATDELRMERAKNNNLEAAIGTAQAKYDLSVIKYGEECAETKRLLGELTIALEVKGEAIRAEAEAHLEAETEKKARNQIAAALAEVEQVQMGLREQHERLEKQLDESLAVNKAAVTGTAEIVRDGMVRMLKMECDGIKRALSKPNFLAAIEDFYLDHEERISGVLEGPLRLHGTLCGADVDPARISREHVGESKRRLLVAAEVTADELTESVLTCLESWGLRADELGRQVLVCYQKENEP